MRSSFSLKVLTPVFLTYFIDNFGLAIIYPIFTPLFLRPHFELFSADVSTLHKTILLGLLIATFPIAQFFGAPLIGGMSDRVGRKKVFLITILGVSIGYLLTGIGISLKSLSCLWIGRGCTGLFAANLTLCLATIADISYTDNERSKYFGWISAVGGVSFTLAILIGGIFSNPALGFFFSPGLPFFITAVLSILNWFVMYHFFQESHFTPSQNKLSLTKGFGHLSEIMQKKDIRFIYLVYFLFAICWVTSMQFLSTVILQNFKTVTINGISFAFIAISVIWAFVNFTINPFLCKYIKPLMIWFFSLLFLGLALLLTFPPEHTFIGFLSFFLGGAFFAALAWTNGLATISLHADPSMQGKVLGINQSVSAVASMIGPIIGGIVAGIKSELIPLLTGGCGLLAAAILFYAKMMKRT